MKKYTTFRLVANRAALTLSRGYTGAKFYFDLTQGPIETIPNPLIIYNLVKMARKFANSPGWGEHNSLLQLIAKREDLVPNKKYVYWHPSYHISEYSSEYSERPKEWITLHEWLKQNGYNCNKFQRDSYFHRLFSFLRKYAYIVKKTLLPASRY